MVFSNYSVKVSGSGLVIKRNRATLRKILPTAQTENLLFCQGQRGAKQAVRELESRTDLSRALGRGTGSQLVDHHPGQTDQQPVLSRDPVAVPGVSPAKGLVDSHEESHVVTPPVQGVDQILQPGVVAEPVVRVGPDQVDLTHLGEPENNSGLRRGTRLRVKTDR